MQTHHLYKRLTHRYVDSYRHLDESKFVGTVKLTPPKVTVPAEDFDQGGTYVQYARLPRGADTGKFMGALRDSLSKHGCSHEYDCCGCASYSVEVIRKAPRDLLVRTTVRFNY